MNDPVREHFEEWGVHMCESDCLANNRGPNLPQPIMDVSTLALKNVTDGEWEAFEKAMQRDEER